MHESVTGRPLKVERREEREERERGERERREREERGEREREEKERGGKEGGEVSSSCHPTDCNVACKNEEEHRYCYVRGR